MNRLPVVDGGHLVAIATRADLVRAFVRDDARIAREIWGGSCSVASTFQPPRPRAEAPSAAPAARTRLEELAGEARHEWEETARAAEFWPQQAAMLAGERPLELARAFVREPADVKLVWRNTLGVVYSSEAAVALPTGEQFPPGGSAALAYAASAHRRALEAAAQIGAA